MKCPMMQMHGQGAQGGQQMPMMHGGQQMQGMMGMCPKMCSTAGRMMGHGMIVRDMMQVMSDMIKVQQKMIRGLSPVEKREMSKDMERMLDKIERMMAETRGMMMRGETDQPAPAPEGAQREPHTEEQGHRPAPSAHH